MNKLDQAIVTIEYILKKRKRKVEEMERRIKPTDNEKIFIGEETELFKNIDTLITNARKEIRETMGKLPPQAVDLEEAVLAAIILESSSLAKVPYLTPDHFYSDQNKIIMEAIVDMVKNGYVIDMRTIVVYLRKMGRIDQVGGAAYIAEITSKVASAANIEYHARILVEFTIKRELILLCGQVMKDSYEDGEDCFDLMEKLERGLKKIKRHIER